VSHDSWPALLAGQRSHLRVQFRGESADGLLPSGQCSGCSCSPSSTQVKIKKKGTSKENRREKHKDYLQILCQGWSKENQKEKNKIYL
jgi:hypothetical protein